MSSRRRRQQQQKQQQQQQQQQQQSAPSNNQSGRRYPAPNNKNNANKPGRAQQYQKEQQQKAFAAQQLARVQSEQQQQQQQQPPPGHIDQKTADPDHRDGKTLWNVVKKKPVTLSQKNRALEDAVKVLQQRLSDNDLETTVDGEDPLTPDEEIIKLRTQISQLTEQCNAAAQHKRAASLFEKQARDARAELEKLKEQVKEQLDGTTESKEMSEMKELQQQLLLKEAEIKLSAEAGALARRDLQVQQQKVAARNVEIVKHQEARTEAERALAEAKHMVRNM